MYSYVIYVWYFYYDTHVIEISHSRLHSAVWLVIENCFVHRPTYVSVVSTWT